MKVNKVLKRLKLLIKFTFPNSLFEIRLLNQNKSKETYLLMINENDYWEIKKNNMLKDIVNIAKFEQNNNIEIILKHF